MIATLVRGVRMGRRRQGTRGEIIGEEEKEWVGEKGRRRGEGEERGGEKDQKERERRGECERREKKRE